MLKYSRFEAFHSNGRDFLAKKRSFKNLHKKFKLVRNILADFDSGKRKESIGDAQIF